MTDRNIEPRSGGILAIWPDVAPELEADFNEWYWREHFPERLSVPGFLSAQRYRAIEGAPRYLAWYELESVEFLDSLAYQERLHHPTEWTRRVTEGFRNYTRAAFRPVMRVGNAAGAVILTLRLPAGAKAPATKMLSQIATERGITRVQLWSAVETNAPIPQELVALREAGKAAAQVVTVEAADPRDLASARQQLQSTQGIGAIYQFLCGQHA